MTAPSQFPLMFEPGLTALYREHEDCVAAVVHAFRGGVDAIAPALDMSPSELSRRLNAHLLAKEGDTSNRPLRDCDVVKIIAKTKDYRPIFWLVEKFLQDPETVRTTAIYTLAGLMPVIQTLVEQSAPVKQGRR